MIQKNSERKSKKSNFRRRRSGQLIGQANIHGDVIKDVIFPNIQSHIFAQQYVSEEWKHEINSRLYI